MGLLERRACSFVGADRKMIRYQSYRSPETELRGRLRVLANERRREPSGINRIYRACRKEGLTVRKPGAATSCGHTSAVVIEAQRARMKSGKVLSALPSTLL